MNLELTVDKQKQRTFEIAARSNSSYTKKGTERYPNPVHLNSQKYKNLTLRSKYCLGDRKGYVETQYVINAPVIHVPDIYVDKKGNWHSMAEKQEADWVKQLGLKSLGYDLDKEYKRGLQLAIGFEFGILALDKFNDDPTLLSYVQCHENNVDAPNAQYNKNQNYGFFKFRCVQNEKKAEKRLDTLDNEAEALTYVSGLRTKKGEQYMFTEQNINKLNATVRILGLSGFEMEDHNQKLLAVQGFAKVNATLFVSLVEQAFNEKRIQIINAMELNVLDFKKNEVKLNTGEKENKPTKRDLIAFASDNKEKQVEELSAYFLCDKGTTDCRDFILLLEAAKQTSV